MQSLCYVEPGRVEWREAPPPHLHGDLEALVVPIAASRCDFDRDVVLGKTPLSGPFSIGHEAVARVMEVGDDVRGVAPGDIAVVVWHISCGQCDRCQRGLTGHCRKTPPGSSYGVGGPWGGLFDDVVRIPYADAMLTPVPSGVDPVEVSAAGDSLGLGHAIMEPHLSGGATRVAILGQGPHGLYQVAFAVGLGAESVLYVDEDSERRATAITLGASNVADSPYKVRDHFDLIVDASANVEWLARAATRLIEPEGVIECLGGYFGDIRIPGYPMYVGGTRIRFGLGNNGPHVKPTIDAVVKGMVRPSTISATLIPWNDLPRAYLEENGKLIARR